MLFRSIDRLEVSDDKLLKNRLADSVETAFYEGQGTCRLKVYRTESPEVFEFSKRFEADGMVFEEPTEMMFNFNNPLGACPTCEGFGKVLGIDEDLVVPDKSLSIYESAPLWYTVSASMRAKADVQQSTRVETQRAMTQFFRFMRHLLSVIAEQFIATMNYSHHPRILVSTRSLIHPSL